MKTRGACFRLAKLGGVIERILQACGGEDGDIGRADNRRHEGRNEEAENTGYHQTAATMIDRHG
jgi:hypothetical protein